MTITTPNLVNWTVNQPGYSQTISATGGMGALTFSETAGILPTGLTLSGGGVLSGTPTATGSFSFTVTATDSTSASGSHNYTVTINPIVTITTPALLNGTVATAYSQTINGTGGTGSLTFSQTSGTLPTGLTLSSSGVLSGTPTLAGGYTFTVKAADTVGASASQSYTVFINPALTITTTSLPNWTVNQAGYNQTISASGGISSYMFSTTAGTLPTGLTLFPAGVLSGTPTAMGSFSFTVTVTDSVGASASQSYTVLINPPVTFTTTSLPNWTVNQAGYSQTISASGGTGSKMFSTTAGTLPTGLTLSTAGVLSGTPTALGSSSFTVTATDSVGASASQNYTVTINPALAILPTSLPAASAGTPYVETISVSGGTTPYTTFAVTSFSAGGTGLTSGEINTIASAGTIAINGTPTGAGTVTFTVNVTDTAGATLSQNYALTVNPASATHFLVSALSPQAANGFFSVTVKAEDMFNMVVTGYTGLVHFTSTDTAATLPADSPLTKGQGTFTVTLRTLGDQTITATDTSVTPLLTGTSGIIHVVCPMIVIVAPSYTGTPGTPVDGHIIGFDAFANVQQGITVVCAGGTVLVNTATYDENVTINKSMTLQGSGSATAILMGIEGGVGLAITGPSVSVGGLTVENFTTGLTADSPTTTLILSDVKLTGNTVGGTIAGVRDVTFTGNGADETLTASATQFGRSGDNLLSYSGVSLLALDGNGGNNTLDLSSAAGAIGVTLTGPGSLEGFAGTATLPGLIFTNISNLVGNGASGSALTGFSAPAAWTANGATSSQYSSGGQTLTFTAFAVLNGGAARDAFTINSTAAGGLTANGQGGGDNFQVALGDLAGPVTLNDVGGSGVNTATLTATNAADRLRVTASAVTLNSLGLDGLVNYAGLEGLMVNAGGGTDAIDVQGTAAGTPTTVSGSGTDAFVVTSTAGLLNSIAAPLTLNGGSGNNSLKVSEAAATTGDTVFVTNSLIYSNNVGGFKVISYQATGGTFGGGVSLFTGQGDDTVSVQSTRADATTLVNTGGGNDFVLVSSNPDGNGTLTGINGPLAIDEGAGNNRLEVSEAASTTGDTVFMTNSLIYSNNVGGFKLISYQASGGTFGGGVSLFTGQGDDTVSVQSTRADATTSVNTGGGNDFVLVTSDPSGNGTLAGINGPLAIDEGAGNNRLEVSEAASTTGDTVFMTNSLIYSNNVGGFKVINYQAIGGTFGGGVSPFTGQGDDTVSVQSTRADATTFVNTGGGNDFVLVSSNPNGNGTLAGINGPLAIDEGAGINRLEVSEAAAATADTVVMTNSQIFSNAVGGFKTISYQASGGTFGNQEEQTSVGTTVPAGIALFLGQAGNTLNFASQLPGAPTFIQMGNGPASNVANFDVFSNSAYAGLTVDLGTGVNTLNVNDRSGGGQAFITAGPIANTGKYVEVYSGSSSEIDYVGAAFQPLF